MEETVINDDPITGYELSRQWFNWCYENPEKISPTDTAMYFFIIDHWNRMGQKDKFGLPAEMTKDAIGVKNYKTFSKSFENLIEWKFIKVYQRSKNQYSANIIGLVKNTKAFTKALTKASLKHETKQVLKHVPKQVHDIVGIIEPNNLLTIEPIKPITTPLCWRESFEVYSDQLKADYERLITDKKFISEQEEFYPGVDIVLSIKKAYINFWSKAGGWKNKKSSKTKEIDWKATFTNAIGMNKVYKPKNLEIKVPVNDEMYKERAEWR